MVFVSEEIIEQIVTDLEKRGDYSQELEQLQQTQPVIAAYVVSENFDVLTNDEKEYFLYLALVICKSAQQANPDLEVVVEAELGEAEEKNYELMQENKARDFRDKLNVFFENYPQEDLLAFAEDALVIDPESESDFFQVTKEGQEPIFLALKSIIDVLDFMNEI